MLRDGIDAAQKQGENAGKQGMHKTPQQLLESHKRLGGSSEYSQKACEDAEKLCCTVGSTCRCKQFLEGDHPLVWKRSKEVQTGRFISVLRKSSSDAVFL